MKKLLSYLIGTFVLVSSYDSVHANAKVSDIENHNGGLTMIENETASFKGRIVINGEGRIEAESETLFILYCEGHGVCIDIDFDRKIAYIPCINLVVSFQSSVRINGTDYNNSNQTLPNGVYEIEIH